jgi:anti-sigma factor (TIGR02949 family)
VIHPEFAAQVAAYLDEELTASDARDLEAHLARCPDCARLRDDSLALRAALKAQLPTFEAPQALRQHVRAALRAAAPPVAPRRFGEWVRWRPLALAASVALVAVGGWRLGVHRAAGEALADEVLASHIRSLMPGHLTDVPSSDQHTVKPWFNGRVDFSPPVYDFSTLGYPLLGGRLDYLDGHPAAVLVYGRRQHVINVFLWPPPASRGSTAGPATVNRQGYHLLHWTTRDYAYWVVSDLGLGELREFSGLLQRADSAAVPPR